MANLFLDANTFIDIAIQRRSFNTVYIAFHDLFLSSLTVHILAYTQKIKMPSSLLENLLIDYQIIDFNQDILNQSITGPTPDFEDNVQLHSAAAGSCTHFITSDKQLLHMGYFGSVQITDTIPEV